MKLFDESYNWWNPWHWKKISLYNQECDKHRKEMDDFLKEKGVKSLWELEMRDYEEEQEREEKEKNNGKRN